jgi:hypothetical protein
MKHIKQDLPFMKNSNGSLYLKADSLNPVRNKAEINNKIKPCSLTYGG